MATSARRGSRTDHPTASRGGAPGPGDKETPADPKQAVDDRSESTPDEERVGHPGAAAQDGDDRGRGQLSDLVRRALIGGVEAVLHSEDGVRDVLSGVQDVLPRDVSQRLVGQVDAVRREVTGQVDSARREALGVVAREMRGFLDTINISEEVEKILTSVSFEVRMQVRFVPNEDGRLRAQVRPAVGEDKPKGSRWRRGKSSDAEDKPADADAGDAPQETKAQRTAEPPPAAEAREPAPAPADKPAKRAGAATEDVAERPPHEPGSEPRPGGPERRGEKRLRRAASVARSAGLQAVDTVFRVAERTTSALADLDDDVDGEDDDDDFRDFRELVDS